METLLNVLCLIVLLLLIGQVVAKIWRQGESAILHIVSIIAGAATIVFAIVSLTAFTGLTANPSPLVKGGLILFLMLMAGLLRISWGARFQG
jgi:hypothetical protein